ncbi:MAG: MFS transporter [Gammaproteobacteria bacterium]|jgi:AAA family ATP:ADP antiporter|nr:MFS transporter [Gammaproteobacteria bacterium]|tara:strand:+ start:1233 stop:2528 length:1296 start_codon:yes stop_codon:yes gene_type:complete
MIKNTVSKFINLSTRIKPNEIRATLLSFSFVFLLMTAYFILRPVRDAMSSDWTDTELSWLWTSTFFFSFLAVSLYGEIISRIKFNYVVPGVYVFFSISFFAFNFLSLILIDPDIINKIFYVWLSVFSLFHVSVFWSFISNIFSKEQAPRLFGFIASGASIGAILGPSVPILFANQVGTMNLLIIAGIILLIPVPLISWLEKIQFSELKNHKVNLDETKNTIKKDFLSGFSSLIKNPYLISISLFILFYVVMNTFIYFELRKLLIDFDRDARTQIWASIDLIVNVLAIVTAIFLTGRITTRFGMPTTLALIPVLMVLGWLVVAISPILLFLIGLQIIRRAGNYAITKPGREMLFTLVDNEARYKVKPVIDIVVYRGGDMLTAWFYTFLTATLGLGLSGVSIIAAAVASLWALTGLYLGKRYKIQRTAETQEE